MTETVFATLKEIDPRTAWLHEAHVFTPWLAANLDRLSQAIGIPLDLERAEAPVGRYSADILARNPQDGSAVLIENQLEASDHTHLGQIMTYLTGLDAKTMIWVAPSFRDEHLSALRWLNEHTVDPFAFFAVRVRVVQIADSPLAPLFEVLERPNGWDRRLQEEARESRELSEVGVFRRAFWQRLAERHPGAGFKPGSSSSQWYPVGETGLVISAYITLTHVGVFVRGGRGFGGAAVVPILEPHAERLAAALGEPLGQPEWPFNKLFRFDLTKEENWDAASDALVAETHAYARTIADVIGAPADG